MGVILEHTQSGTSLNLGNNVVWVDQFQHNPVPQTIETGLDGAVVIEHVGQLAGGRPITLNCGWIKKELVDQLIIFKNDLAKQDLKLTFNTDTFLCTWKHSEGGVLVTPVSEQTIYGVKDYFSVSLFLIEK